MDLNFDHIIYFTKNPEEMKENYEEKGFYVVNGGDHDVWGTYNTLMHFGLEYIEFLGIKDFETFKKYNAENVDYTLMSSIYKENYREGFHNLALRTTEIEAVASHLKDIGFLVEGPKTFKRTRNDGTVAEWQLLFVKDKKNHVPMPFIIDWGKSDEARLEDLKQSGSLGNNGTLIQVNVSVKNKRIALQTWHQAFNLKKVNEETLQLGSVSVQFSEGIAHNQVVILFNNETIII